MPTADVSGSNSWAEDVMDFVAREHAMVREHLAQMLAIAAVTPTEIVIDQRERLSSVFQFVHTELLPLMSLEEASVYPALGQIPGVPSSLVDVRDGSDR
jgi:Hemerythrin HHE cation binding domain